MTAQVKLQPNDQSITNCHSNLPRKRFEKVTLIYFNSWSSDGDSSGFSLCVLKYTSYCPTLQHYYCLMYSQFGTAAFNKYMYCDRQYLDKLDCGIN